MMTSIDIVDYQETKNVAVLIMDDYKKYTFSLKLP